MSVFEESYARFYDLLYRDKDYASEADYVATLIRAARSEASSILELGCGTGRHAELLAGKGFSVCGVDQSAEMVRRAGLRAAKRPDLADRLRFVAGDVTDHDEGSQFDAVISLFHVVSYQTTNDALHRMFAVASRHLTDGGVFIFDFWFGPAVLGQKPAVRVKRLEDSELKLVRIAEPVLHVEDNTVEVNYTLYSLSKEVPTHYESQERHLMRYFTLPEIDVMLEQAGMSRVRAEEWMTGKLPSSDTWGVVVAARKDLRMR